MQQTFKTQSSNYPQLEPRNGQPLLLRPSLAPTHTKLLGGLSEGVWQVILVSVAPLQPKQGSESRRSPKMTGSFLKDPREGLRCSNRWCADDVRGGQTEEAEGSQRGDEVRDCGCWDGRGDSTPECLESGENLRRFGSRWTHLPHADGKAPSYTNHGSEFRQSGNKP